MGFKIATNAAELNQAMFEITHGLYILTARRGDKLNGQCLDALMQLTNRPQRIAIGVGKQTLTHEMIREEGLFTVNVLNRDDPAWREKVKHFGFQSGRNVDKFASIPYEPGENGAPIIPDALAFFECEVVPAKCLDADTHTLFVGLVKRAGAKSEAGEPLTYNLYRQLMKK